MPIIRLSLWPEDGVLLRYTDLRRAVQVRLRRDPLKPTTMPNALTAGEWPFLGRHNPVPPRAP